MLEQNDHLQQIQHLAKTKLSANVRSFEDNDEILVKNDEGTTAFIILSGCVLIFSGETSLACRKEGELIGEQVLFSRSKMRSASAKALGHVRLLEFSQTDICDLEAPDQLVIWRWYSQTLSQKLADATQGRVGIDGLRAENDALLKSFVPHSGINTARTALLNRESVDGFQKASQAVIWFSDLAGFSSATKDKPPSETATIISEMLGLQTTLIEQSGGEIDKFMGDGVMAFWLFSDDDNVSDIAEKAVKAALSVNAELPKLAEQNHWNVGVRIGLHIGDVSVGYFGTDSRFAYTIIGDAVNTASRYEQAKDDSLGNIRISPELFTELPQDSDVRSAFSSETHAFDVKGHEFNTHVLKEKAK